MTYDPRNSGAEIPLGGVTPWTTDTPPTNFLLCYGQAISRTTYSALFALIGTTFGVGDGSTTFNIPDRRGRFGLGQDNMGGSSADRVTKTEADSIGSSEGVENHTLIESEMASHSHSISARTNSGTNLIRSGSGGTTGTPNTDNTGGGGSHNNMSPYLTLNFIIKAL